MKRQLKIIYLLSILPLLTGSLTFFYWFYKRTWFADNADIELFAFFTILGFILFALITIILCIVFVVKNRTDWKKIIIPIVIIGLTFPVIDLYGTLHSSLLDKAFVRIINDTDKMQIKKIWSENFYLDYFESKGYDFIISFYPTYSYDYTIFVSDLWYNYKINPVYVDLKQGDTTVTYILPDFSKGDCKTIRLTEIVKTR